MQGDGEGSTDTLPPDNNTKTKKGISNSTKLREEVKITQKNINQNHIQSMRYGQKHARQYDFWVVVEASKENLKKVLQKSPQKSFKETKEVDQKLMIQPWKKEVDKKVLLNSHQIPTTLCNLHFYFYWADPKPKGSPIYMNIWVILGLAHKQLADENRWWLSQEQMNLGECTIQAGEMTTCNWALYSMNQLDRETSVIEISNLVDYPVVARCRIISSGLQGNTPVSKGGQNDDFWA